MEIEIKSIPHKKQRYDTCGDYWWDGKLLKVRVTKYKNPDYEFLIMIHELIEEYLTRKKGIKEEDIKKFDEEFDGEGEPGDDPKAPYHKEHVLATDVEYLLADYLNVDWNQYEDDLY